MNRLYDWYWSYGIKRQGKYAVGLPWLDRITNLIERNAAIANERARNLGKSKGCLAIWGPSQAGKSTLLSSYIDGDDSGDGSTSALSWPGGAKARFTPKNAEVTEKNSKTIIFNPYNMGSDASGIATRYTVREAHEIPYPKVPCILQLATEAQIMHAIAAGYLYECDPKNAQGAFVSWDPPQLDSLVMELPEVGKDRIPSQEAFAVLRDAFYTVEAMIQAREKRFTNLTVSPDWTKLRESLLEKRRLICSPENAQIFARKLLWDNHPALNSLYDNITSKIKQLKNSWGKREIHCSLDAAAVLLDINSFRTYSDPAKGAASPQTMKKVGSFNWAISGDNIEVTVGSTVPSMDIAASAFGLFQASIGEIVVPLLKSRLKERAKHFASFISHNDLLDFPGVPQQGSAAEDAQINIQELSSTNAELFTRLFKRGKTISMVASRAKELSIDSFLLLVRSDTTIAKPDLLNAGVEQWHKFFEGASHGGPFPIHVNLTFFSSVVNDVYKNGPTNLGNIGDRFNDLGEIASAKRATFHLTNYPHLAAKFRLDAELLSAPMTRQSIKGQILGNMEFNKRFPGIEMSLDAILESADGGTEVMFSRLSGINFERRFELYNLIETKDVAHLKELCGDLLPDTSQSSEDRQRILVKRAKDALHAKLDSLSADSHQFTNQLMRLSNGIKDICYYAEEDFESLPGTRQEEAYVRKHLEKWLIRNLESDFMRETLQLSERVDRNIFLNAIISSCPIQELAKFVEDCSNNNPDARSKISILRYALSVAFSNSIFFGKISQEKIHADVMGKTLGKMHNPRNYEESPYYTHQVSPFIKRLNLAETAVADTRPTQTGDSELASIINSY